MKPKLSWDESQSVAKNARGTLPFLANRFFAAGRKAVKPGTPAVDLHAFRLQTKRFRYTLEPFRTIYGATLDTLIESLRKVQGFLGDINDCEVSRRLVLQAGSPRSPQVRKLLRMLHDRQTAKIDALQEYWDQHFAPEDAERRWVNYLAVYPGRVRSIRASKAKAASAGAGVVRG